MRLIDNWKDAKCWFSVHAMLWSSVIQIVWSQVPEDMKTSLPSKYVSYITSAMLILGILGRVINQEKTTNA